MICTSECRISLLRIIKILSIVLMGLNRFLYFLVDLEIQQNLFLKFCTLCILRTRNQALVLEFEMWRHFDTKQKSFTLFNCVDYSDPKFLIFKTKKRHFFLRLEIDFFDPMLSRKTFATNSLK
jgi:hypothetical protein